MGSADQPTRTIDGTAGVEGAAQERFEGLPTSRPDPMLAPPSAAELDGSTPLALLEQALAGEVSLPPIRLPVPEREGVSIEFDTNIDNDLLTAWRKRAIREDPREGTDPLKLACIVLSNKATGFYMNGRPVTRDGQPLTFASQEVWQMVRPPALNAVQAVKRLFGVDAHVIIAGEEVLRAAGYGDSIQQEEADPTDAPLRR